MEEREGLPPAGSFARSWQKGDGCAVEETNFGGGGWWDWLRDVRRLTEYLGECHQCEEFTEVLSRFWGKSEEKMELVGMAAIGMPWRLSLSGTAKLFLGITSGLSLMAERGVSREEVWLVLGLLGLLSVVKTWQEWDNLEAKAPFVQVEAIVLKLMGVEDNKLAIGAARLFYYLAFLVPAVGLALAGEGREVLGLSLGQALAWFNEGTIDFYLRRRYKRD